MFARNADLNKHMNMHTGKNIFKCVRCEKNARIHHLINHMMTHTDEKPPRCDKCEKNFCTECLFSSPYEDT